MPRQTLPSSLRVRRSVHPSDQEQRPTSFTPLTLPPSHYFLFPFDNMGLRSHPILLSLSPRFLFAVCPQCVTIAHLTLHALSHSPLIGLDYNTLLIVLALLRLFGCLLERHQPMHVTGSSIDNAVDSTHVSVSERWKVIACCVTSKQVTVDSCHVDSHDREDDRRVRHLLVSSSIYRITVPQNSRHELSDVDIKQTWTT